MTRVRIAPSPTGRLHIGTARTALYNFIFARQTSGTFIVRIEDTDRERSRPEFEKDIRDGLRALGIVEDEFYRQSERTHLYRASLEKLLGEGKAFYCAHGHEELEKEAASQRAAGEPPRHICPERGSNLTSGILRLKNDAEGAIIVDDIIRGGVEYQADLLGDFSLAKSLEEPLYNFAVVIDDQELKITHIIRGEDHLSNTPKQILIMRALGYPLPRWAHLPLLLNPDRSKLSKRQGASPILDLLYKEGYLPEALLNFTVLLGWHPKDEVGEILDLETMKREFSLERVQKGGAVVSYSKLDWLNKEYVKRASPDTLLMHLQKVASSEFLKLYSQTELRKIMDTLRTRITKLSEVEREAKEIFEFQRYSKDLLLWDGKIEAEQAAVIIDELVKILSGINTGDFTQKGLEYALGPLIEKHGKGNVLWPLRAALSGKKASLGPYELADILGKNESVKRLKIARDMLS
ncbi:MAG: glutamate--tRNA ligase [Candidatus Ryanbacteria bacterium]|nr:glutamate--tRNA ligase [Candidatus Ryanbacteria bacterium]